MPALIKIKRKVELFDWYTEHASNIVGLAKKKRRTTQELLDWDSLLI